MKPTKTEFTVDNHPAYVGSFPVREDVLVKPKTDQEILDSIGFGDEKEIAFKANRKVESTDSGITFDVDNVEPTTDPPRNRLSAEQVIRHTIKNKPKLESWSQTMNDTKRPGKKDLLMYDGNNFIGTVCQSYKEHRALILSPDMIWTLIIQGLALHVNDNPERYRKKFVNFEGKTEITVVRNDFIKGARENTWEDVFPEFSEKIQGYIGDKNHEMIVKNFSTTGPLEKATFEVCLMDVVQSYFDYRVMTLCGIPSITLKGTAQDWEDIYDGVKQLTQFNLGWWTSNLLPMIKKFVNTANGDVDADYWRNFFKEDGGSGGPYVSGQINNLFPYLKNSKNLYKNDNMGDVDSSNKGHGTNIDQFPSGLASVPFKWAYYPHNTNYQMKFYAGFFGGKMDPDTYALSPTLGWAITQEGKSQMEVEQSEVAIAEIKKGV